MAALPGTVAPVRDEADYVGVYVRVVEKGAVAFACPRIRLLLLKSGAIRFVKSVLSRCDDVDGSVLRESMWAHQGCPSSESKYQGAAAQSSACRLGAPHRL